MIVALATFSYSLFIITDKQTNNNILNSTCLSFEIKNEQNEISLQNSFPLLDEEGKKLTPFTFTVKNTCDAYMSYTVSLETLQGSTLANKYVKVMLNNEAIANLDTLPSNSTYYYDGAIASKILGTYALGTDEEEDFSLRIWMDGESGPHRVEYAVIRNAETALWLDSCVQAEGGLYVADTKIENMSRHGILSKQNRVEGVNLCISSAQVPLMLAEGGCYAFRHGTFVSRYMGGTGIYSQALVLTDYREDAGGGSRSFPMEKAEFANSVFYGSGSRQIELDFEEGSASLEVCSFDACLISMLPLPDTVAGHYRHCLWNQDPLFADEENYNFEIDTIVSPLVGTGDPAFATGAAASDIKGLLRAVPPCIGAYEFDRAAPAGLWDSWLREQD